MASLVVEHFLPLIPSPPLREFLLDTLRAQVDALLRLQDKKTGLWHTLLVDETSYVEASASAGFAFGMLKAVRKGYIDSSCLPAAVRAVEAVIANIDAQGELRNVSFGTGMGHNLQFYKAIPLTSMPYGQSMAILCLSEFLNHFI